MNPESAVRQKHYWDGNLDPRNLGTPQCDGLVEEVRRERDFFFTPERCAMLGALAPLEGKLVLEVGAGLSYQVSYLAECGARVVACDLSPQRLAALRNAATILLAPEVAARIHYVVCAAEALPFRADVFDAVCTKSVLIHTRLEEALGEAGRVLAPHGKSIFSEPMRRHPLVNVYRRTLAPREWRAITHYFGDEEIELVRRHFSLVHLQYDYLSAFLACVWQFGWRSPALFWLMLPPLRAFDRLLMRLFPALQNYAWFVTLIGHPRQ